MICLERVPDSLTRWQVVNKTSLFPTKTKNLSKTTVENSSSFCSKKRKREWAKKREGSEIKRTKIDASYTKKTQWKTECKQLLNQIKPLKINDNLANTSRPRKKSLNECYAIVHNNYAITLIENLLIAKNSAYHTKKRDILNKAKQQFIKSAHCYTQAGLIKQKGKIIECINSVMLSLQKLSPVTAKSTQRKTNLLTPKKHNFRNKNKINAQKPYYLTRTFFKNLCADNPHYHHNNRISLNLKRK